MSSGAVAGGLAGCGGNGGDGGTTTTSADTTTQTATDTPTQTTGMGTTARSTETETPTTEDTETTADRELVETPFEMFHGGLPSEWNMNPFNQVASFNADLPEYIWDDLLYGDPDHYTDETGVPDSIGLATGFSVDNPIGEFESGEGTETSVTVELDRDDWYWLNGAEVTLEDLWIQKRIDQIAGSTLETGPGGPGETMKPLLENEVLDPEENTLTFTWTEGRQRNGALGEVVDRIETYREQWRPFLNDLLESTTDDAINQVAADIMSVRNDMSALRKRSSYDKKSQGLTNTAYAITDWSGKSFDWELRSPDEHPKVAQDYVTIPDARFHVGSDTRERQLIIQDRIDMDWGLIDPYEGAAPKHLGQASRVPQDNGYGLITNYQNVHLGRRGVRQALVAGLDIPQLMDYGFGGGRFDVQTGLSPEQNQEWLTANEELGLDNILDDMFEYPLESDMDLAEQFMEKEGYELQNGTWVDEEGNEAGWEITTVSWTDLSAGAIELSSQLANMGINSSIYSSQNFWGDATGTDYDMLCWAHQRGDPEKGAYDISTNLPGRYAEGINGPGMQVGRRGKPAANAKYPKEIGATSCEEAGGCNTFNIYDKYQNLWAEARSPKDQYKWVRQFARFWNFEVPDIYLGSKELGIFGDLEHWDWPDPDEPIPGFEDWPMLDLGIEYVFKNGYVDPKYK